MRTTLLLLLSCLTISGIAQNLVLNPFFIPSKDSKTEAQLYLVPGYSNPNQGTTDLYSRSASRYEVGIPQNFVGWQEINGSDHYAGIIAYYADQTFDGSQADQTSVGYGKYSEYLQVELREPLVQGRKYRVSFDASLAESSGYASNLGVFICNSKVEDAGNQALAVTPQIETSEVITDNVIWTSVGGVFTANGGEKFLIIGKFSQAVKLVANQNGSNNLRAYYYLSNVVVEDNEENPEAVVAKQANVVQEPVAAKMMSAEGFPWPVLNFETNRNAIEIVGYEDLNKLSDWLKSNPAARIRIEGHTDKVGNDEYNLALSNSRAAAAKKYLISKGIAAARMETNGNGSRDLADPNGPADNLKNRRVTITVIKN